MSRQRQRQYIRDVLLVAAISAVLVIVIEWGFGL